jgi:hypothetical protein
MRTSCPALLSVALLLFLAEHSRAGEDFYLLMFSAQRVPNDPDFTHCFATFVRATWPGNGPCPRNPCLEVHTISWLPANLAVRTLALLPERGRNFDLDTTIRFHMDNDTRVSMWGPYRIDPDLYCRALKEIALLQSGEVQYKTADHFRFSDHVCNCCHAISALADGQKFILGSRGWGDSASEFILKEKLKPWVIDPDRSCPWVASAIGLDRYPISRREWRK